MVSGKPWLTRVLSVPSAPARQAPDIRQVPRARLGRLCGQSVAGPSMAGKGARTACQGQTGCESPTARVGPSAIKEGTAWTGAVAAWDSQGATDRLPRLDPGRGA